MDDYEDELQQITVDELDMLTENDVVAAVVAHLQARGDTIDRALDTTQQGIDIEATRPDGTRCFIEAKGATSSKEGTNRFGKEFSLGQVKNHIAVALLKCFQTLNDHPGAEVYMALPGNANHRKVLGSMASPLGGTAVRVLLVDGDGRVEQWKLYNE